MDTGIRVKGRQLAHQHVPLLRQHVLEHLCRRLFLVRRIMFTHPSICLAYLDGALPRRPGPLTALCRGRMQVLATAHGTR